MLSLPHTLIQKCYCNNLRNSQEKNMVYKKILLKMISFRQNLIISTEQEETFMSNFDNMIRFFLSTFKRQWCRMLYKNPDRINKTNIDKWQ